MEQTMKFRSTILVFVFCLVFSPMAGATNPARDVGLEIGAGLFSNYGLIGVGGRYFVAKSVDVHATLGLDPVGLLTGIGSRWYLGSNSICIFFIPCNSRYYLGGTVLRSAGDTATVTTGGTSGKYKTSDGWAGQVVFGSYDTFGSGFTMGFELGYRAWFDRPEVAFESGTFSQADLDDLDRWGRDNISGGISLGWSF
jgi:hypothetical protein